MLCSNCSLKEASFHYKYILNGKKSEIHLCSDCAKTLGYIKEQDSFLGHSNFLGDFFSVPNFHGSSSETLSCPSCGTPYRDIRRSGYVGCDQCYESFAEPIDTMLAKIQPSTVHKGKLSGAQGKKIERENAIKNLKEELSRAIIDEKYEQAAVIRDKIKELEAKGGEA